MTPAVPLDEVVMDYITSELKGVVSKAQYGETDNRIHTISYNDVKAGDWYANAVNYVTLTGLMNGTGDGFSPNLAINRGMMVTVLYRMAGSPEVTAENPFTDVPADTWYTDAVIWLPRTTSLPAPPRPPSPPPFPDPGAAGHLLLSVRRL